MAVTVVCRGVGEKGVSLILEKVSRRQEWYMRLDDLSVAEAEGGGSAEWLETWSRQRDWSQSQSQSQRQVRPGIRPTLNAALLRRPRWSVGCVALWSLVHMSTWRRRERESLVERVSFCLLIWLYMYKHVHSHKI